MNVQSSTLTAVFTFTSVIWDLEAPGAHTLRMTVKYRDTSCVQQLNLWNETYLHINLYLIDDFFFHEGEGVGAILPFYCGSLF